MLFNSLHFVLFFPVVVAVYFTVPHRYRWIWLLSASYYFYMCWKPGYALLLLLATTIDYTAGRLMGSTEDKRKRRRYLIMSLSSNLGLLFFFKYYNFFHDTIAPLLAQTGLVVPLPLNPFLLPVGISFYTFQSIGYAVDVYRGTTKPEKHFGIFALYVSFFPQLVAGPIERSWRLLPQMREHHTFDYDRVTDGLKLMAWGYFKKMVIADHLAMMVNTVYDNPAGFPGATLTLATVFFAFQIFCDFSGYSDIAIGAAQVMGFRLITNFRRPYFATSISDFWHRWHISLSSWFRDYVYIPLGGSRVPQARWYANILIVFLLSGFWHGANWTFLIWGALHGTYMVVGVATQSWRTIWRDKIATSRYAVFQHTAQILITFGLVCFAWIFFRSRSFEQAAYIITHLHTGWTALFSADGVSTMLANAGLTYRDTLICVCSVCAMELVHVMQSRYGIRALTRKAPLIMRWAAYSALLWSIFLFGVLKQQEFIYFTF